MAKLSVVIVFLVLSFTTNVSTTLSCQPYCFPITNATDADLIRFNMNLEFLEAEFFLHSSVGRGLDAFNKTLAKNGPPPVGATKANLDPLTNKIIEEFAYQEIGHLRAIDDIVGGIQRPLIDLTAENFARIVDTAVGRKSWPMFDPYANSLNFLLATYIIPYVGLTGYVGAIPNLRNYTSKRLVAGLTGVEGQQDAVVRTLLYERASETVEAYGGATVAELTTDISMLRNTLGKCGIKDEGIIVPPELGAENRTCSNIISADAYSLTYSRTPPEVLRIVYGTGDEHVPGGFFPCGGNGRVAKEFLKKI